MNGSILSGLPQLTKDKGKVKKPFEGAPLAVYLIWVLGELDVDHQGVHHNWGL